MSPYFFTEGVIETDLYIKPTDNRQHLLANSCHPVHCKEGIPSSQAVRLNRISSEANSLDKQCNDCADFLWTEVTVLNWCERKYFEQEEFQTVRQGKEPEKR